MILVTDISSNRVKLGIRSPQSVPVYREELYQKIREENRQAALISDDDLQEAMPLLVRRKIKLVREGDERDESRDESFRSS